MNRETGSVCCLSCEIAGPPLPTAVMQGLKDVSVADIARMDTEVQRICFQLSPTQMVMLKHAAKRTLTANGEDSAKVLHDRFYQRTNLKLDLVPAFKMDIGTVLQVLDDGWPVIVVSNLMTNLLNQAVESMKDASKYPNLNGVLTFRALRIYLKDAEIYVFDPDRGSRVIRMNMIGLSIEDRMMEFERRLITIDSVSVIIVHCNDTTTDEDTEDFQMWIDLFKRVYGDLEKMWIVLVIRTLSFWKKHGEMSTGAVLRSLNRNADRSTLLHTKCANVVGTHITIVDAMAALSET